MMAEADILVQHSLLDSEIGDIEGLRVTILEAMAHGLPEAVSQGSTGYLVAEGDVAAMAEHIVLLARDAGLRRHLGSAGWQRAKERVSWQRERTSLVNVLGLAHEQGTDAEFGDRQGGARRAGREGSAPTGKWVRNGTVFYLQDVTNAKALSAEHTHASVTVHVLKESG